LNKLLYTLLTVLYAEAYVFSAVCKILIKIKIIYPSFFIQCRKLSKILQNGAEKKNHESQIRDNQIYLTSPALDFTKILA
jgi:hypothetical protein